MARRASHLRDRCILDIGENLFYKSEQADMAEVRDIERDGWKDRRNVPRKRGLKTARSS